MSAKSAKLVMPAWARQIMIAVILSVIGGIGGTILVGFRLINEIHASTEFNETQKKVNVTVDAKLDMLVRKQDRDSIDRWWILKGIDEIKGQMGLPVKPKGP